MRNETKLLMTKSHTKIMNITYIFHLTFYPVTVGRNYLIIHESNGFYRDMLKVCEERVILGEFPDDIRFIFGSEVRKQLDRKCCKRYSNQGS